MFDLAEFVCVAMPVTTLGIVANAIKDQANGKCILIKTDKEFIYLMASIISPIIIQKIYHLITAKCLNNVYIFPIGGLFLLLSCFESLKNNQESQAKIDSVMVKIVIFLSCIFLYNGCRWMTMG